MNVNIFRFLMKDCISFIFLRDLELCKDFCRACKLAGMFLCSITGITVLIWVKFSLVYKFLQKMNRSFKPSYRS